MVPFVLLPDTIEGDVRLCSRDRVNRHERGYSFTAVGVWGCPWWSLSTSVVAPRGFGQQTSFPPLAGWPAYPSRAWPLPS